MSEESKELLVVDTNTVQNLVYTIRGQQVMLDSDLAEIYGYEVKALNQQVKRNINRFPEDFMFQLTREELDLVKSQFVTSRSSTLFQGQGGGRRKLPFAFTEQGIYMLATVLRGELAERQSIYIMRAFREMRHFLANNKLMFERIHILENHQKETDAKLDQIFDYIADHEESSQKIFFSGQIFDAFNLLTSIISQAEREIVLIDGYVDVDTLNILAKKKEGVAVSIYTLPSAKITKKDIETFNKQYPRLTVDNSNEFHDRFLILDRSAAYHIGASLKDAGKKCFGVSKIEDEKWISELLQRSVNHNSN